MIWWGICVLLAIGIVLMVIGGILYFVFAFLGEIFQGIMDEIFGD